MGGTIYKIFAKQNPMARFIGCTVRDLQDVLARDKKAYSEFCQDYWGTQWHPVFHIFIRYGVENCEIAAIKFVKTTNFFEMIKKTKKIISETYCINMYSDFEYKKEEGEYVGAYADPNNRKKHKKYIMQKRKCICGSEILYCNMSHHKQTQKHKLFVQHNFKMVDELTKKIDQMKKQISQLNSK